MNIFVTTVFFVFNGPLMAAAETAYEKCPGKWDRIGSYCYIIQERKHLNWYDALKYCQTRGGHLAEPPSHDVNQRVRASLLTRKCSHGYWLGMKKGTDNKFRYQSTNAVVSFKAWLIMNPSNTAFDEDCVSVKCLGWSDYNCTDKRSFVCQLRDLTSTSSTTTTSTATATASPLPRRATSTLELTSERNGGRGEDVLTTAVYSLTPNTTVISLQQNINSQSKGPCLLVWSSLMCISLVLTAVFT